MAEQIVKTLRGTSVRLLRPIFNSSGAISQYLVMMASGTRCPVSIEDLDIKDPEILKQIQKGNKMTETQEVVKTQTPVNTGSTPTPVVEDGKRHRRTKAQMAEARAAEAAKLAGVPLLNPVLPADVVVKVTTPTEPTVTDNVGKEPLNIAEPVKQRRKRKSKVVDPVPVVKKKPGRPPKVVNATVAVKRPGRPPKTVTSVEVTPKVKKGRGRPSKVAVEAPIEEITLSAGKGPVPQVLKDNVKLVKQIGVISADNKLAVALLKLLNAHIS